MSKLSRTVLKEIVKECIVEIFEESFFSNSSMISESRTRNTKSRSKRPIRREQTRRAGLDNISYGVQPDQTQHVNERFNKKIDTAVSSMTKDPVMADIFKDTASTTLQTQIGAENSKGVSVLAGGDAAAKKAYASDPAELFSESASKWATLAFAENIKK